jgi:hypothetical protein
MPIECFVFNGPNLGAFQRYMELLNPRNGLYGKNNRWGLAYPARWHIPLMSSVELIQFCNNAPLCVWKVKQWKVIPEKFSLCIE